jgi:hypothetical protein
MNGRGATETSTRDETQPAPGEQPLTYTRQASRVGRRLDRAELLVMRFRWALLPFISGLLIGALVGATNPASSFATPCSGVPYNTAARSNDGSLEHRGDKADNDGIWVPATGTSVSCIRVSSLIITHNGFADQVEVGWFDASGRPECGYTGNGGPRQLWFARVNGTPYCATQTPDLINAQNQFHVFNVHDDGADGNWKFVMDGTVFKSESFPMTIGVVTTNGERHGDDIANSDFNGLKWENGTGWQSWSGTGTYGLADNDPNFKNDIVSDTHVKVVAS